jgi:hypothetical protein
MTPLNLIDAIKQFYAGSEERRTDYPINSCGCCVERDAIDAIDDTTLSADRWFNKIHPSVKPSASKRRNFTTHPIAGTELFLTKSSTKIYIKIRRSLFPEVENSLNFKRKKAQLSF